MSRTINFLGWAMLASLALAVVLVVAAVSMAGSIDPVTIRIDGDMVSLDHLDAGQSLLAIGGIAVALLVVVVVVPLAVLIPLAIAAVTLAGVLLVLAGVLALVCSPLIFGLLVIWLMVRLIRGGGGKSRAVGGATITR